MTLQPSDSPDWTGIPGSVRYLGLLDLTGTGGVINAQLDLTPASYDGALQVIVLGNPGSTTQDAWISLSNLDGPWSWGSFPLYKAGRLDTQPVVVPISRAVGPSWRLAAAAYNAVSSTLQLQVFAIPSYPTVRVVDDGQPILTTARGAYRQPYWSVLNAAPNAGILASVTFAAVNGWRWILDHAVWTLSNGAGAATGGSIAQYSSTSLGTVQVGRLSVPAVANTLGPPVILGPDAGVIAAAGEALTVGMPALVGGLFQTVWAGAYLVPVQQGP